MLVGGGLFLAWTGLRPAPEPLGVALARLDRRPTGRVARPRGRPRRPLRRVPAAARAAARPGHRADAGRPARRSGRTPEEQAARVGSYALLSVLFVPWVALVAFVAGFDPPAVVYLIALALSVSWAIVAPFLSLRQQADGPAQGLLPRAVGLLQRHRDVAWPPGAASSRRWRRRRRPARAGPSPRSAGRSPPATCGASRPGRRSRRWAPSWRSTTSPSWPARSRWRARRAPRSATPVSAKARTIRERIIAETEQTAAAVTERMSLPGVLMALGFLVFIGYPALAVLFRFGT